ncbi:hypothetical protein TNCV_642361 [Trichonephila clavipes]|nr:hypothetical protein TNCV_642361 [Trichonephila clavipes]
MSRSGGQSEERSPVLKSPREKDKLLNIKNCIVLQLILCHCKIYGKKRTDMFGQERISNDANRSSFVFTSWDNEMFPVVLSPSRLQNGFLYRSSKLQQQ